MSLHSPAYIAEGEPLRLKDEPPSLQNELNGSRESHIASN
jgi:hypothetical protein